MHTDILRDKMTQCVKIASKQSRGAGEGNIGGRDETSFGQQLITVEVGCFYFSLFCIYVLICL